MFANQFVFTIASAIVLAPIAASQTPFVASVVNAASLIQPPAVGHALTPGSLATIFGQNLATTVVVGSSPYGLVLGGTSVSVGSFPAALLYVSPTQINFQVPAELSSLQPQAGQAYTQATLIVRTGFGSSSAFVLDLYSPGPGIFTLDSSGCGRAAILNVKQDGSVSLNSPDNSAAPGDYLEIFGTGFAIEEPKLTDGFPAPLGPYPIDRSMFPISILNLGGNVAPFIAYSGRAPGLVGVEQVNVQIPAEANQACNVPLAVSGSLITSQLVPVSIHANGGACVDPPQKGSGQITLQRTTFMNTSQQETDVMSASFASSPAVNMATGNTAQPLAPLWSYAVETAQDPSGACGTPGVQPLSVGTLTVQNASFGLVQATSSSTKEGLLYTAVLPAGGITPGVYTIGAGEAGGVGPIQVSMGPGQPIQPTVQFPKSMDLACSQTSCGLTSAPLFVINWTGGDASEVVNVRIVQHSTGGLTNVVVLSSAPATAHSMDLGLGFPVVNHGVITYNSVFASGESLELDVDVSPSSPLPLFVAPGLGGGITATWVYEYRFLGIMP